MIKVLTILEVAEIFSRSGDWSPDAAYALASSLSGAMDDDNLVPSAEILRNMFTEEDTLLELVKREHSSEEEVAGFLSMTADELAELEGSAKVENACFGALIEQERTVIPTASGYVVQRSKEERSEPDDIKNN